MGFSVMTYNVLFNNAFTKIKPLLEKYKPDFICLQEVDTSELNLGKLESVEYKLADYSNSFIKFGKIFGVATFYNQNKFRFIESGSFNLPRSYFEIISLLIRLLRGSNKPRTVLKTDFAIKESNKLLTLYNIHLSLYGINSIRLKQIKKTLNEIKINTLGSVILTGDFNYFPYNRKNLETLTHKYGLSEATKKLSYTIRYRNLNGKVEKYNFFQKLVGRFIRKFYNGRLKVDYTFYKNLKHLETKRVNSYYSDHLPILSTFENN